MLQRKSLTADEAMQHAKMFCAYQERCHSETKHKLYSFGLNREEVENVIGNLIDEDYLNEERFARSFARGKFRMKQWGKVKIKYELKQRHVSDYCIRKAMEEIDENEYIKILEKLTSQKKRMLRSEKSTAARNKKITNYLLQKGYERDAILATLKD